MFKPKKPTHIDRAIAKVANVQERLHAVGSLPRDTSLELRTDGEFFWLAYTKDGESLRTSAAIGNTPRDVARWADGFAHAVFTVTESAYMALAVREA